MAATKRKPVKKTASKKPPVKAKKVPAKKVVKRKPQKVRTFLKNARTDELPKGKARCSGCMALKITRHLVTVNKEQVCHGCIRGQVSALRSKVKKFEKKEEKETKLKEREDKVLKAKTNVPKDAKDWFAVQIYGNDAACQKKIMENARKQNLYPEFISRVVIPRVREVRIRNGKKVFQNRKAMPGYLLVKCQFNDNVRHCVEGTNGYYVSSYKERLIDGETGEEREGETRITSKKFSVVRVLPFTERFKFEDMKKDDFKLSGPATLSEKEVEKFTNKPKRVVPTLQLGVGDRVRITNGPFEGLPGTVRQLHDQLDEDPVALVVFWFMGTATEKKFNYSQLVRVF